MLVVDPTWRDSEFVDAFTCAEDRLDHRPILIYTNVSAKAMGLTLRLGQFGVRHLMLYDIDDGTQLFLELMDRILLDPVEATMLREISQLTSGLPVRLVRAIELMFRSPTRVKHGAELAELAGMTRRSMYRRMAAAGLQPRHLIDCSHVVRAYSLVRMPGSQMKQINARLQFADPRTLSDLMRDWTGLTPTAARDALPPEQFVTMVVARLLRSADSDAGLAVAR